MTRRFQPGDLPYWPRWLSREQAAAFVGVSPNLFDHEVKAGIWPRPVRRGSKGGRNTWDRNALEEASDKLSGTAILTPEQEAMRRLMDGNRAHTIPRSAA